MKYLYALFISILLIISENSAATVFFLIINIAGTLVITGFIRHEYRSNFLKVFIIAFDVYITFLLITYLDYLFRGNKVFLFPDQYEFFKMSNYLGSFKTVGDIFKESFSYYGYHEFPGAAFFFGLIAFIANSFGGNNWLIQSLVVSFISIYISLFLYLILLNYFDTEKAKKYSLYFALFSPVLFFSPWLLRDMHIALFFTIAIYILHKQFSLFRYFFLLLLSFIVITFRFESGMFFSFFPIVFLIINFREKNAKPLLFFNFLLVVFFVILLIPSIEKNLTVLNFSLTHYSEYTNNSAKFSSGLGRVIYTLPLGIKQLAIIIFSQISSFPPWYVIGKSFNLFDFFIGIASFVVSVFWSCVFLFFTYSLFFKRFWQQITFSEKIFLILIFVFLLGNSPNMEPRRLLGIYPLIYIIFLKFKSNIPTTIIKKMNNRVTLVYVLLLVIYVIVKI